MYIIFIVSNHLFSALPGTTLYGHFGAYKPIQGGMFLRALFTYDVSCFCLLKIIYILVNGNFQNIIHLANHV